MPSPRRGNKPGDVIGGKYRLQELLGEGGMGSVWVAENVDLAANVALKLIRADAAEPSANERFLSEARVAAQLNHSAITRVFDTGKTKANEPFIVMELLEGETLGQRLARRGSIDGLELVQTLLPIIDALHCAHSHGVVHRDLKPDNVFIARTEGGIQPKLLDFGIAKLRGESAFKFSQTKLTQAGTLIGSPDYMSPEQARGELDLDARSDIWALCVLAYECLVGRPPFQGDNYNALLWNIIHDEPIPITVFQAGDSELWRLLKGGFAKDRTGRWESAKQLGEALAAWLESHGITEDICARSLHASWLPAERPTRPELLPFKELPSPVRASSNAPLVAPPTLPMRRPGFNLALWVAGVGLILLAMVILFVRRAPVAPPTAIKPVDSSSAPRKSPAPPAALPERTVPSPAPAEVRPKPDIAAPIPGAPHAGAAGLAVEGAGVLPPPPLSPPSLAAADRVVAGPEKLKVAGTLGASEATVSNKVKSALKKPVALQPDLAASKPPKAEPVKKKPTRAAKPSDTDVSGPEFDFGI
jgi:eukaryotic-like serine/threonine-protein kinase